MKATRTGAGVAANVLKGLLGTVLVGLALATTVVPLVIGGAARVVLTGSMKPTLEPGAVVVVRAVPASDVKVGDIVTFQPISGDPALITHRVIAKGFGPEGLQFVTRGDANNVTDKPILAEQVRGVFVYQIPWIGYAIQLVGGTGSFTLAVLAALLLGYAAYAFLVPTLRRKRSSSAPDEPAEQDAQDHPAARCLGEDLQLKGHANVGH